MSIKNTINIFFLLLSLSVNAQNKQGLVSGPWAGNVELRNATIWIEVTPDVKNVAVKFHANGQTALDKSVEYKGELGKDFNPIKIELNGLEMNTTYDYKVFIDGKEIDPGFSTKFSTKDLWQFRKPAPDFTFLTGSCAYFNEPIYDRPGKPYGGDSSIFDAMAKEKAAFMLWLGDNWYTRYPDYASEWGLHYRPSRERKLKVLQPFLKAMHHLQKSSPPGSPMRIRTALVTARSAPAHDRAIRTLMSWDIEVDEAMFLGGLEKGPFLSVFEPDFYFDDQLAHVHSAASAGPSGHVDSGVANVTAFTPRR